MYEELKRRGIPLAKARSFLRCMTSSIVEGALIMHPFR